MIKRLWELPWKVIQSAAIVLFGLAEIFRVGPKQAMVMIACIAEAAKHAKNLEKKRP